MDEVKFAIKSLIAASVLLMVLQMKVGGQTLESKGQDWLENSPTSQYLRKVASGGVLAITNGSKVITEFAGKAFGDAKPHIQQVQKASRLNLEIKRSSDIQPTHQEEEQ